MESHVSVRAFWDLPNFAVMPCILILGVLIQIVRGKLLKKQGLGYAFLHAPFILNLFSYAFYCSSICNLGIYFEIETANVKKV